MNGVFHFSWGLPMINGNGFGTFHMMNGQFPIWIYYKWNGELQNIQLPAGCEEIKID